MTPNRPESSRCVRFTESVAARLRARSWVIEDFKHMVGLGYDAEVQYSSGATARVSSTSA